MKNRMNTRILGIGLLIVVMVLVSTPTAAAPSPMVPESSQGPDVIVSETGLPAGAMWVVGVTYYTQSGAEITPASVTTMSGQAISFSIPDAISVRALAFSPTSPYIQTNSPGANVYGNETVTLTVIFQHIYFVTFIPVGLPLNGIYGVETKLANSTRTTPLMPIAYETGNFTSGLINGTYDYQIYMKVNASGESMKGSSGSFVVNGHNLTVKVFFTANAYHVIIHDSQVILKWVQQNWESTLAIGVIFVVVGYLMEIGLPSRAELKKNRRSKK